MREPFFELKRTRLIKGRDALRGVPLAERLRAAQRIPQAVVKVAAYKQGRQSAAGLLNYMTRKGALPLETEMGEEIVGLEDQRALVKEWAHQFDRRKKSRDVAHVVFSAPAGYDPEALRRSVRNVITRHWPGHQAAFTLHEDRKHPHVHVALVMKNQTSGKKLRFRKEDLYTLRQVFAEAAREEGLELAASPRAARGVLRKGWVRAAWHLIKRGVQPLALEATRKEVAQEHRAGNARPLPWEHAIRERHKRERKAYFEEAARLRKESERQSPQAQSTFLNAAWQLERFAHDLPLSASMREQLRRRLREKLRSRRRSLERPKGTSQIER